MAWDFTTVDDCNDVILKKNDCQTNSWITQFMLQSNLPTMHTYLTVDDVVCWRRMSHCVAGELEPDLAGRLFFCARVLCVAASPQNISTASTFL